MGLFSSMSVMLCMQNDNSLDGTLIGFDGNWISLAVQGGKRLGTKGSEGLPGEVYKFITKEHLTQDTLMYAPMLKFTLGAENGDGKNIMAFFLCNNALKKNKKTFFPKLVARNIMFFMLPDQIHETVIIKNSKLSGLMKKEGNAFKHKKDLNINSIFAMKTIGDGPAVKLIAL